MSTRRREDSRRCEMRREALNDLQNNHTKSSYKKSIDEFLKWEKENYNEKYDKHDFEVNKSHIQAYEKFLEQKETGPATIHTKLAAVCKGLKVSMNEIEKPKRTAGKLTRDRDENANAQGKRELENPKYEKSVTLEKAIGIRKNELSKLTKENLKYDESGYMCVEVLKGKGGKYQLQRILPQHQEAVLKIFEAAEPGARVLAPKEISSHISYHGIRAKVAQEAYDTYKKLIDTKPGYREKLKNELSERFKAEYNHNKEGYNKKAYEKFMKELDNEKSYVLRGESKELALKNGRPTELDRVALMATSVFHLSHWRLGVASTNYLNK